jgi:hypothetical protein
VETGVSIRYCKRQLARLWFAGAGIVSLLVLLQSLHGRYGAEVAQAWSWLLPTLVPTLSLIIGQRVFDAVQSTPDRATDRFLYRLTASLSSVYLLAVLLVVLLQPLSTPGPIELMVQSNVWLGPMQGLVIAPMGAFFVKAGREGLVPLAAEEHNSRIGS